MGCQGWNPGLLCVFKANALPAVLSLGDWLSAECMVMTKLLRMWIQKKRHFAFQKMHRRQSRHIDVTRSA